MNQLYRVHKEIAKCKGQSAVRDPFRSLADSSFNGAIWRPSSPRDIAHPFVRFWAPDYRPEGEGTSTAASRCFSWRGLVEGTSVLVLCWSNEASLKFSQAISTLVESCRMLRCFDHVRSLRKGEPGFAQRRVAHKTCGTVEPSHSCHCLPVHAAT